MENASLEAVLHELCKEMKEVVDVAVKGYKDAAFKVRDHLKLMQEVLETSVTSKDESAWNKMFEAAMAKSDANRYAEYQEKEAVAAIDNVIEIISAGRKNKITSNNLQLMVAEDAAEKAINILEKAKKEGKALLQEVKVMEEYRDLIEAGRQQLHKEMDSIMPDINLADKHGKLSEEELNMFITHAYKKVLHLQKELARQQTLEQEKFRKALEKQSLEIHIDESEKVKLIFLKFSMQW